jgi:hypothetical protein
MHSILPYLKSRISVDGINESCREFYNLSRLLKIINIGSVNQLCVF